MNPQDSKEQGGNRRHVLAALCLTKGEEEARTLFSFLGHDEEALLQKIASSLVEEGEVNDEAVLQKMDKASHLPEVSLFEHIHPGWILERMEGESPQVLGVLFRILPGETVKYILENCPDEKKALLPKIQDSYRVSPDISEVVCRMAAKRFALPELPLRDSSFSFQHIAWLKAEDLKVLFWDLGLEEIRKGFWGGDPQLLRTFLARFPAKMAQEIRSRVEGGPTVTKDVKEEAQKHLISLPLETLKVDDLFREIGYSSLSRSLADSELHWAEFLCQKLPPEEGYRLRKIIQGTVFLKLPGNLDVRKQEVLRRVYALAATGVIRRYWKEEGFGKKR